MYLQRCRFSFRIFLFQIPFLRVMVAGSLRREVLQSFKKLHKVRCQIFQGDDEALEKMRKEINDTYKKNKNEADLEKIKELTKFAYDVIHELKTSVVQMWEVKPGRLQLQLRPEIFEDQPGMKVNNQNVKK